MYWKNQKLWSHWSHHATEFAVVLHHGVGEFDNHHHVFIEGYSVML